MQDYEKRLAMNHSRRWKQIMTKFMTYFKNTSNFMKNFGLKIKPKFVSFHSPDFDLNLIVADHYDWILEVYLYADWLIETYLLSDWVI